MGLSTQSASREGCNVRFSRFGRVANVLQNLLLVLSLDTRHDVADGWQIRGEQEDGNSCAISGGSWCRVVANGAGRTGGMIGTERKTCYILCVVAGRRPLRLSPPDCRLSYMSSRHENASEKMQYLCFSRRRDAHLYSRCDCRSSAQISPLGYFFICLHNGGIVCSFS